MSVVSLAETIQLTAEDVFNLILQGAVVCFMVDQAHVRGWRVTLPTGLEFPVAVR